MISLLYSLFFFIHPIHLSVSEVNYSEKDKALQITSRIFLDDLELSVREFKKDETLDLMTPGNDRVTEQLVSEYLAKKLTVKLDGKVQKLNFLGLEREEPAVVCYIEIEGVKKFKTIEVRNEVIMDVYDDQSNIVHVTYKGAVKSFRLLRNKPVHTLTFD